MIKIQISEDALADLDAGFCFYENQEPELGDYFSSQLRADIDGLKITAGTHCQPYRHLYRLLSQKFPYAVFYEFSDSRVLIVAVVDSRRDPGWIKTHLDSYFL